MIFRLTFLIALMAAIPAAAQIRITMAEAMKNAVASPQPEYSALAKQARISGDVVVEIKINGQGEVKDVTPVSGNVMLSNPVVKTLKQWKFKPFESNGKPTEAVANLRFNFKI